MISIEHIHHLFLIHSSGDGPVCGSHLLAAVNDPGMNTQVYVSASSSSGDTLRCGTARSYDNSA